MTRLFTGNVFITTSREAIERVFFPKTKLSSFRDALITLTEEDIANSYIVTNGSNSNLLSFDFIYSISKGSTLVLRFLETDTLFEKLFYWTFSSFTIISKNYRGIV
jgi:hypothetical protein